jgi:hypothetical protein
MRSCRAAAICAALLALTSAAPAAPRAAWQAVVVAGDDEQPVFDNAIRAIGGFLERHGVAASAVRRFSASAEPEDRRIEPATLSRVLRRIAQLPVRPGGGCFVFITSHGERGEGIYLAYGDEILRPAALARALSGNCAAVPTVVIVSGCYSGAFAAAPMAAPNRIIMTAAREDRPSFGCQADRVYTVFDACLLGALQAPQWRAVFARTAACVSRRERRMQVLPSLPQASFAPKLRDLAVRF